MSDKHLLLLASTFSYRVQAFEEAAAALGIPVIRGEDVPPPMLGKVSNRLAVDYQDVTRAVRRVTQFAEDTPLGAIVGLDDSGTLIAARASQQLGLPFNAPEATLATRNKAIMRRKFAEAGVPSPHFTHCTIKDDIRAIAHQVHYPCVIKPTTLAGSRGVMRADSPEELLQRHQRLLPILQESRCDEFLIEAYIPGVEVALEGLLDNGELHMLALFDKPDPLEGPFFEETIYVTPSRLLPQTQQAIKDVAAAAARALGLRNGPCHAELRLSPDGPIMVEIAARSIGGNCSKTLRFGTDQSLESIILQQAFGMGYETRREASAGGVMMIPIPETGILTKVSGIEEAEKVAGIEEIEIAAHLHHKLVPLPEGNSYLGFIFARAETPEEVEAALREAHARLHFAITPEIPLTITHL